MTMDWDYGENDYQRYYDAMVGDDYLCVFANKFGKFPNTWMAFIQRKNAGDHMIHDKTANDRQRKRQGLPLGCHPSELRVDAMLCSTSPEYMMKKAEHCYRYNKIEVSR